MFFQSQNIEECINWEQNLGLEYTWLFDDIDSSTILKKNPTCFADADFLSFFFQLLLTLSRFLVFIKLLS